MPEPAALNKVSVGLNLGFFSMNTEWNADPREREAAWALYVELVTRISAQELPLDAGMCREALDSLYALFAVTRAILRAGGPDIGTEKRSVGYLALSVLNHGLRPFLSRWHPLLLAHEQTRSEGVSQVAHEKLWAEETRLRGELEAMRKKMWSYAGALAVIAGLRPA